MRERKGWRLGLVLVAAAAAGAFALVASGALAAGPTVSIGSGSAKPGAQVALDLKAASVASPGLGAWSIDITYDPAVVTPVACVTEHGAVCNTHYDNNTVRTAGASAIGFEGDTGLAKITFECANAAGESAITVALPDFADATLGGPVQIAASIVNGKVSCTNATPVPQVPTTGTGGGTSSGGGSDFTLLIALLAGVGVTALAGFGVLRTRTNRA
jgi:hypothetical protein